MKHFLVEVWYADGKYDFFKSTSLAAARAQFVQWRADWMSTYVRIS